jgi:hypothetical protein
MEWIITRADKGGMTSLANDGKIGSTLNPKLLTLDPVSP